MINLSTAIRIINVEIQSRTEDPIITEITEYSVGWLFYWNSRRSYWATDMGDMIFGNGPILVDKRNGSVIQFGSGNFEEEVEAYVRKYFDNPPDSS